MATVRNDYLLGLFEPERMEEEVDRVVNKTEPSIAQMVEKAIKVLKKNSEGFYLFVEGANIDKGHHSNRARKALEETLAMDAAVEVIMRETSKDDTLVVVSADHSHGFAFSGYSSRGESVLGLSRIDGVLQNDTLGNPYTLFTYGNGPGYNESRVGLTDQKFAVDAVYPANFPLKSEKHGGEDVAIYASGPMSHLFIGTHEQSHIPHAFAYAACLNGKTKHCDNQKSDNSQNVLSPSNLLITLLTINSILIK